jgi:hypothetical protein
MWTTIGGVIPDLEKFLGHARDLHITGMVVAWVLLASWVGLGVFLALGHRFRLADRDIPIRVGMIHRLRERLYEWRIYNE